MSNTKTKKENYNETQLQINNYSYYCKHNALLVNSDRFFIALILLLLSTYCEERTRLNTELAFGVSCFERRETTENLCWGGVLEVTIRTVLVLL